VLPDASTVPASAPGTESGCDQDSAGQGALSSPVFVREPRSGIVLRAGVGASTPRDRALGVSVACPTAAAVFAGMKLLPAAAAANAGACWGRFEPSRALLDTDASVVVPLEARVGRRAVEIDVASFVEPVGVILSVTSSAG
jgi:hypothetical protein